MCHRKCGNINKPGKSVGITSERMGETSFTMENQRFIPTSCSFMPNLFFPWNPFAKAGEQTHFMVVHTMKKKIL